MGVPSTGGNNTKWIVAGVLGVAVLVLAAFLLFGGGSRKKDNVASSNDSTAVSSGASSNSSASRSSSSSSTAAITAAELQARMLASSDVGPGFKDSEFAVDNVTPAPCGQQNPGQAVPARLDVGSQADDATTKAFFREEVSNYKDAVTARRAFDLGTQGLTCTQGTLKNGSAITLSPPKDVSSTFGTTALVIDFQVTGATGEFFVVLVDNSIMTVQLNAPSDVNSSTLPDSVTVVKRALTKLST